MATNNKEKQKQYDKERAAARARHWTAVLYPEDLPEDWYERLKALLIKGCRSPLHTGAENADGTVKKEHYHIMLSYANHKTAEQFREDLAKITVQDEETGALCGVAHISTQRSKVTDRTAMVRYFAHLDNPEKIQYDPSEIEGFNGFDVLEVLKHTATEQQEILTAIEEFCEENNITELCKLSKAIRYTNKEWYRVLTTQSTLYLSKFLTSLRHSREEERAKEEIELMQALKEQPAPTSEPRSDEEPFPFD